MCCLLARDLASHGVGGAFIDVEEVLRRGLVGENLPTTRPSDFTTKEYHQPQVVEHLVLGIQRGRKSSD